MGARGASLEVVDYWDLLSLADGLIMYVLCLSAVRSIQDLGLQVPISISVSPWRASLKNMSPDDPASHH